MVEEETRRYRPTKNYLGHLPALDLTAHEVRNHPSMMKISVSETIFLTDTADEGRVRKTVPEEAHGCVEHEALRTASSIHRQVE